MIVTLDSKPYLLTERQLQHYFQICIKARKRFIREANRNRKNDSDLYYKVMISERYIDLLGRYHMEIKNLISSSERKTNPSRLCIGEESMKRVREIYHKIEIIEHLLSRRLNIEVDDIYYLNLCNRSARLYRQAEAYRRSDHPISKRVEDYKKHHPNTKISI